MASFADQPMQFAPYVQTVPLEAMAKVGMIKQQQYDAGVEKSRAYLEKVSGLPINHPGILKHLQGKLDTIKTQLKTYAAADFSNQEVVNSVAGLAKEVYRDPIIQNGVKSAAWMKNEYDYIDNARKKGKSSPLNEAYFSNKANEWFNNPDLTTPFNERFSEYIDLPKKWVETLKSITPSEELRQIPFETFMDPTTGQMKTTDKIAAVMTEAGVKGVDANTIENAIRATLTPEDMQQMRINSWAQFRDVTPEMLQKRAKDMYADRRKFLESTLESLEKELPNLGSNPDEYSFVQDQIEKIKNSLGKDGKKGTLQTKHEDNLASIAADPEAAKLDIYKEGAIAQFADAFHWKATTTKYVKSPFEEVKQWYLNYDLEKAKYNLSVRAQEYKEKKDREDALAALFTTTGSIPAGDFDVENRMVEDGKGYIDAANAGLATLSQSMGKTPEELLGLLQQYPKNPSVIPWNLRPTAETVIDNMSLGGAIQQKVEAANKAAREKFALKEPLTVTAPDGQVLSFTPDEIKAFDRKKKFYKPAIGMTSAPGLVISPEPTSTQGAYWKVEDLSPKERVLYENIERNRGFGSAYSDWQFKNRQSLDNVSAEVRKNLSQYAGTWVTDKQLINTEKPQAAAYWAQITTSILSGNNPDKGSVVLPGGVDKETLAGWLSDAKTYNDLTFNVLTTGLKRQLTVSKGPDQTAVINLGPIDSKNFPIPPLYTNEAIMLRQRVGLGGGYTYLPGLAAGKDNPFVSSSGFSRNSFKNLKGAPGVSADLREIPGTSQYALELKVPTSKGVQPYILESPIDLLEAIRYVNNVDNNSFGKDVAESVRRTTGNQSTIQEILKYLQ